MVAYVRVNLRIKNADAQAALAPRFQAALRDAGGRILHFGRVVQTLEGDVEPFALAGVFGFETVTDTSAFYNSAKYAPIKVERAFAQEARMYIVDAN